jgi:6-phosphogluconolactonase (cycloisomerase 2 family)
MRLRSLGALVESCICLVLSLTLAGCGGGSSSGGGGSTPPPPQTSEFLFSDSFGSVVSYSVNTSTGALSEMSTVPGNHGSGFGIAANSAGTFLYSDDDLADGIDAFSISSSGSLTAVSGSPFSMPSGWTPFEVDSLAVDPAGKFLYAPDGPSNTVVGFTIDGATGALGSIPGSPFATGPGPAQVVVDPSDRFVYVSDCDTLDQQGGISAFTIDSSTGALTPIQGSPFNTDTDGPDGLVVSPSGKFLFAAVPFYGAIAAFTIDSSSGALTQVTGSPFAVDPNTDPIVYSIALTPSGNFLYALGSLDGKVYAFAVDSSTGALTPAAGSPFEIGLELYLSNLRVDPSGKFLYIAGTGTNELLGFNIDTATGALTPISVSPFFFPSVSVTVIQVQSQSGR